MAVLQRVQRGLSSPQQFKVLIQTKEAPTEGSAYFNEDLLPTPPSLSQLPSIKPPTGAQY